MEFDLNPYQIEQSNFKIKKGKQSFLEIQKKKIELEGERWNREWKSAWEILQKEVEFTTQIINEIF